MVAIFPVIFTSMSYSLASADLSKNSEAKAANDAVMSVERFYAWYLNELELDRHPLTSDSSELKKFVSAARLRSLADQVSIEGSLDVDYFLQAQDYLEDWASNITASSLDNPANDKSVTVSVTLGHTESTRWHLIVVVMQNGDGWKLDEVKRSP